MGADPGSGKAFYYRKEEFTTALRKPKMKLLKKHVILEHAGPKHL